MKHYFTLMLALFFTLPLFCQTTTNLDYEGLMRDHRSRVQEFMKSGDELAAAGKDYAALIAEITETAGLGMDVGSKGQTQYSQNQLALMVQLVPLFASVAKNDKGLKANISLLVEDFGNDYGLTAEQRSAILGKLMDYSKAYSNYTAAYNRLKDVMGSGKMLPPSPPPPPPPVQQHH